jgi:hypothetical protein
MDTVIFNGNVAINSTKQIKQGDELAIAIGNRDKVACPLSSIQAGDKLAIVRLESGDELAVKTNVNSTCVKITDGFYRDGADNEVVDLGTFEYTWDGSGRVVIYDDCAVPFAESMWVDDTLQVSTKNDSLSRFYGGPSWGHPALTLNTILKEGKNEIDIKIINGSGKIGCPTLYITRWDQNPPYPG